MKFLLKLNFPVGLACGALAVFLLFYVFSSSEKIVNFGWGMIIGYIIAVLVFLWPRRKEAGAPVDPAHGFLQLASLEDIYRFITYLIYKEFTWSM